MAFGKSNLEEGDPLFPGEGWFLYWKTSSSLWKAKLQEFPGPGPILVPLNWAFHSPAADSFDFASDKSETDLRYLAEIASVLCKKIIFLVPLTAFPFLPNGGLPPQLSRTLALNSDKMAYGLVDLEGNIHKLYSFFDPRVYQSFRKFIWELGQYVSNSPITMDFVGLTCGHIQDKQFYSYIEDHSKVFDQGFTRFLDMKKNDTELSFDPSPQAMIEKEESKKGEFTAMIRDLYLTQAKECLGSNWGGELKVAFLGGAPCDIFERSSEACEYSTRYFKPLMDMLSLDVVPSSILLPHNIKRGGLRRLLKDLINGGYFYSKLDLDLYEDEYGASFVPLKFFDIYINPALSQKKINPWEKLGIHEYLDHEYRGTIFFPSNLNYLKTQEFTSERILLVAGQDLQLPDFKTILKVFMNGGRIILDKTGLSEDLKMKLEAFLLENSIALQKVNYISEIVTATLGEGFLVIFEGRKIQEVPLMKKLSFWDNIVNFIKLGHLKIQEDSGLWYYWRHRSPRPNEVNFTEIRRVSFYNPTSYRKRAKIPTLANFEFLKMSDQVNCEFHTSSMGIDIELYPEGSVSVDFGQME